MSKTAADLVAVIDLEPEGPDRYVGHSVQNGWKRVFGGQVIAQALNAAQRTVEGKSAHSLHAYFILGGDPAEPIHFEVERIRDGRSFATRRVLARQRGEVIFVLSTSFQIEEEGLDHAFAMPDAPEPDSMPSPETLVAAAGEAAQRQVRGFMDRILPIEFRPVSPGRYLPPVPGQSREPRQSLWIRVVGDLPDDANLHRELLAYLSDLTLLNTVLFAHGHSIAGGKFQIASLDHALWFHRPARVNQWLLYVQDSPSAQGARGLTRGLLYDRAGTLVASVAQEGLLRRRRTSDPV